jgi:hypothetical protein
MAKNIIQIPPEFQPRFDELVALETQSLWHDFEIKFDVRGHLLKFIKDKNVVETVDPEEDRDAKMRDSIRKGGAVPVAQHAAGLKHPMGSALPKVAFRRPSLFQRIKERFSSTR